MGHIAGEREVQCRDSVANEQGQIGVVGKALVDFRKQRTRCVVDGVRRIEPDQRTRMGTSLKQQARALIAARLDIDHGTDAGFEHRIMQKQVRTQQTRFFPIGDQGQNRMSGFRWRSFEGACGFQHGGDTGFIISRPRPRRHGIIMGQQQDRFTLPRPDLCQDVCHRPAQHDGPALRVCATCATLDRRGDTQLFKFGPDARPNGGILRGRNRVRNFRPQNTG